MISVITCTIKPECINNIFNNYDQQTVKKKELFIILNRDDMDIKMWRERAKKYPNVSIFQLPSHVSVGQCKNFAIKKANYSVIAKFDDDDFYAPNYLREALDAIKKTNADIIGKRSYYSYVEKNKALVIRGEKNENKFVELVCDATLVFRKRVFDKVQFNDMCPGSDKAFQKDCRRHGFKIYSSSIKNFAYVRRDSKKHTWKISEDEFMRNSAFICKTDDYRRFIIAKNR
ncbi:glycosyltransferase [Paenibacillus aestuarii]|uniref:Glycosyltransferase n=1 Tax=Paenibacillus aestuarii TaxID=516965 RepID=A0ABW0K1Q9_9BACL|nr:glycosyltransferase [Paenibacillus aestuarii]